MVEMTGGARTRNIKGDEDRRMPPRADATDQLLRLRIPALIHTRIEAVSQIEQRRALLASGARRQSELALRVPARIQG